MTIWDYNDYTISSIIIKATDYCNLKCQYCYQGKNNKNSIKHMDFELIRKAISDYFCYAEAKSHDNILYIVWHGGEPLMCGLNFFKKVIEIEHEMTQNYSNRIILNAIQTNGTLFSKENLKFFKELHFGIGISIDGIPKHHDIKRVFPNNIGSSKQLLKNIKLLNSQHICFSSICVISKHSINYAEQYYEFFKEIGTVEVDFIPSFFQNSADNLTDVEYSSFLINMFDLYYNDTQRKMKIRIFDDILRSIIRNKGLNSSSVGCEFAGRCGENISLSINGDVYPCDCLGTISKLKLGNLYNENLLELTTNNNFTSFTQLVNQISEKCTTCSVFSICKGGCFNRRISDLNLTETMIDIYCKSRYEIINYIWGKCYEK